MKSEKIKNIKEAIAKNDIKIRKLEFINNQLRSQLIKLSEKKENIPPTPEERKIQSEADRNRFQTGLNGYFEMFAASMTDSSTS